MDKLVYNPNKLTSRKDFTATIVAILQEAERLMNEQVFSAASAEYNMKQAKLLRQRAGDYKEMLDGGFLDADFAFYDHQTQKKQDAKQQDFARAVQSKVRAENEAHKAAVLDYVAGAGKTVVGVPQELIYAAAELAMAGEFNGTDSDGNRYVRFQDDLGAPLRFVVAPDGTRAIITG